ncbi:MAG TPA: methionyl-tRNA formyltransferase, partial [Candidatus Aminicenantes bacterium]|nr:methionyl-tRNA formyltransferase [Candidatus Aminicenantes bacterium]
TALQLHRRIRAFTPWPSVYTLFRGKRLQLTNSELLEETERSGLPPSRVVGTDKRGILLSCAQGSLLRITQVKPECKKAMSARDFAQGARLLCGEEWTSCLTSQK